ncbi:MAG TPA: hypothetical protein VGJ05_19000 [Fimbriiglobus sp.]|jgi:hypothetical protein
MTCFVLLVLMGLAADVPPFFQPPTDFYGAIGSHVTLTASADTTRVPANKVITLTLVVRGAVNPAEIKRPRLHDLPEFSRRFEIEDGPTQEPGTFAYRLHPRTADVDRIPRFRFAYYNSAAVEGKQFPVTYTEAIPLRVLLPVEAAAPKSKAAGPAIFREPSAARGWQPPAGPGWLLGMSAAILAVAAGFVGWWRWQNPDGPRLARIRQTRAVRRVLGGFAAANRPADVADAWHDYLIQRYGLTIPSAAPCDVEAALAAAGFDDAKTASAVALVRRCDAARFGDGNDTPASLAASGRLLVYQWEGLPC